MKPLLIVFLLTFTPVAFFFIASAFTNDTSKKQNVYQYFHYTDSAYSEIRFENDANWSSLGTTNPSTSPCIDGIAKTCVLRIDQSLPSNDPFLSLPEKFALFLQNQPGPIGATDFVNDNYTYRKP
jgi:hypothetical protein